MRLLIKKKTISSYVYLMLFLIAIGDTYIVRVMFNRLAAIGCIPITGTQLMYGLFAVCYLVKFPEILQRLINKKAYDVYVVLLLFGASAVIYYVNGWDNRIISEFDSIQRLIFFAIPVYMMARSIDDYSELMNRFWIIGVPLLLFCLIINSTAHESSMQQGYENYMVIGYQIGFISAMALDYFFHGSQGKAFRWICLVISLYGIYFVIMYGSRGTLLCLSVYLFLIAMEKMKAGAAKKQVIMILTCVFVLSLLWLFSDVLMLALQKLANQFGVNSRTIAWLLQQDSALDSSGRDTLFSRAWELIKAKPFGYGLLADRTLLGMYVHNLFLELMLEFGYLIGGFLCLAIAIGFVKLVCNPQMNRVVWLVVFSLVQLMVSGSYIHSGWFWIALGFMLSNVSLPGKTRKEL